MEDIFFRIYKATNLTNGKVYIGQESGAEFSRKKQHIYASFNPKGYGHHFYFHRAIRKYGEDAFVWNTLAITFTKEGLDDLEKHFIKQYNSFGEGGYNLTEGGGGSLGYKHSDKERLWISIRMMGNSGFADYVLTDEDIKKRVDSRKNNNNPKWQHSDEHKAYLSEKYKALPDDCAQAKTRFKKGETAWNKGKPTFLCINNITVNVDGVEYRSFVEAGKELGISKNTVGRRCRNDNYPEYRIVNGV